jgi:hypothetical protein
MANPRKDLRTPFLTLKFSGQPFDASEPGSRDFTFVISPSRDYFELRVLDASDPPAILE